MQNMKTSDLCEWWSRNLRRLSTKYRRLLDGYVRRTWARSFSAACPRRTTDILRALAQQMDDVVKWERERLDAYLVRARGRMVSPVAARAMRRARIYGAHADLLVVDNPHHGLDLGREDT